MNYFDRRRFLKVSAASLLSAKAAPLFGAGVQQVTAGESSGTCRIEGATYAFEWSARDDRFRLLDKKGRLVTSGMMQPVVKVATDSGGGTPQCSSGKVANHEVKDNKLIVNYEGVNGGARLTVIWRFDEDGFWLEPFVYETPASEDIVAVHYFAECHEGRPEPSLESSYLVVPGISESSAISPVVPPWMGLNVTLWLGHGSLGAGLLQQWGLPEHYFCGFHRNTDFASKGAMREHLSDAFCCGLADLPAGDLHFEISGEKHSPILIYRSDLWKHLRGPAQLSLGAKWHWAIGPNYYEAIRHYYLNLVKAGIIQVKKNSPHKNSVLLSPQFNTWGAEMAAVKEWDHFDEPLLISIYDGLKASGMKPGMFVIDATWERKYGLLEHSPERFPHFEEILKRIRSDGHRLGMWAAFLRCQDPGEIGLTTSHMLRGADGKAVVKGGEGPSGYYLLDFTQPEVQEVLEGLARKFIRRYQPDLVKFDFGYELPGLAEGAPRDMKWAGERLLAKGLEVVVKAMRQEKPDLVVMYYSLSPLFNEYFDLHSPDDMFMCAKEYDLAANRRFFFSGLLGEIGMPTYGSGGYDWPTMPEIWFDSAAIGTLGSLNSFSGDEEDQGPTPERVAKYNGLAQLLRPSNIFSIRPIDADYVSPTRGARSRSWARLENDQVVLLALRACRGSGGKAAKFASLAETSASVVVASKTPEGIERASRLAIVPYGDGELRIRRAGAGTKPLEIIEHAWGNRLGKRQSIPVKDGTLAVPLRERADDGSPVEWLEVNA